MAIHQNLKHLRQLSGLTQQQVADRVGLTRQAISSYESGRTRPDVEMLSRLAEIYGTDLSGVLYGVSWEQGKRRTLKLTAGVLLAAILLLTLAHSGAALLMNHLLPPSLAGGSSELLKGRLAVLNVREYLAHVGGVVSWGGCLVLFVLLMGMRRPPSCLWGMGIFLLSLLGTAACTLPFIPFDPVYLPADYLLISLETLPPFLLLLLFWPLHSLLQKWKSTHSPLKPK